MTIYGACLLTGSVESVDANFHFCMFFPFFLTGATPAGTDAGSNFIVIDSAGGQLAVHAELGR
jgi:hypothetical protein